ncbi:ArnT family glycosyltransferase [Dictyobacter arantiisoli]|uniref:Glycosyltransferase RgtA/B/C/D-like domain-containing protein n=1 Tax=Dictyobacter arantiisoli TaxID=2014874 RepID=A0A5A5TFR0_9CHLR|nr:glycosyltransferase family 39 protein [Dictyobacter arantiisoli]GCF10410.1 hypothetical protein KDI_39740 [Dictyobacter arantiisoli]
MHTRLEHTTGDNSPQSLPASTSTPIQHKPSIEFFLLIGLAVVTLIPRILLARQLDVVTDEVVYILGGKVYLPLITHANISSSQWYTFNYEHPPLAKILMGLSIAFNNIFGHLFSELFAGRIPSILMGTLLVAAVYWLGRAPFGRTIALIAALSLAFSPWLVYFSALAYLDMTMTAFITIAFLTLWHAIRRPWLFPIVALLVGLGAASKYTAVLVVPGIILFVAYYYFLLRPMMPVEERPILPWKWWVIAIIIAPLAFFIVDPALWLNPLARLSHSFAFEWSHSANGHPTFIAGQYYLHVPHWSIVYIIFTKMSAFLTIPAAIFVVAKIVQLIRFHFNKSRIDYHKAARLAYIVIWLLSILGMFSLLNIVVGTHYHLPLAPPVAVAGVSGLAMIIHFIAGFIHNKGTNAVISSSTPDARVASKPAVLLPIILLALLTIVPHLYGLTTVYAAEGYTNEFFQNNENSTLQVAYPGYREALQWLADNHDTHSNVGLIALPGTLNGYSSSANWFYYNTDMSKLFQLKEAHPKDQSFTQYKYLVWPKHLVQRGYPLPSQTKMIHAITGGNTIYCYILEVDSK